MKITEIPYFQARERAVRRFHMVDLKYRDFLRQKFYIHLSLAILGVCKNAFHFLVPCDYLFNNR